MQKASLPVRTSRLGGVNPSSRKSSSSLHSSCSSARLQAIRPLRALAEPDFVASDPAAKYVRRTSSPPSSLPSCEHTHSPNIPHSDTSRNNRPVLSAVCPICLTTPFVSNNPRAAANFFCPRCNRNFPTQENVYVDLTVTAGVPRRVYQDRSHQGTDLFRSPLISFVYERGWRQSFAWAGFPGADQEFRYAMVSWGGGNFVRMERGCAICDFVLPHFYKRFKTNLCMIFTSSPFYVIRERASVYVVKQRHAYFSLTVHISSYLAISPSPSPYTQHNRTTSSPLTAVPCWTSRVGRASSPVALSR